MIEVYIIEDDPLCRKSIEENLKMAVQFWIKIYQDKNKPESKIIGFNDIIVRAEKCEARNIFDEVQKEAFFKDMINLPVDILVVDFELYWGDTKDYYDGGTLLSEWADYCDQSKLQLQLPIAMLTNRHDFKEIGITDEMHDSSRRYRSMSVSKGILMGDYKENPDKQADFIRLVEYIGQSIELSLNDNPKNKFSAIDFPTIDMGYEDREDFQFAKRKDEANNWVIREHEILALIVSSGQNPIYALIIYDGEKTTTILPYFKKEIKKFKIFNDVIFSKLTRGNQLLYNADYLEENIYEKGCYLLKPIIPKQIRNSFLSWINEHLEYSEESDKNPFFSILEKIQA